MAPLIPCRTCREAKPLDAFTLVRGRPMAECKPCRADRARKRRAGPHGEIIRARDREREKRPERIEQAKAARHRHYEANRERLHAASRAWCEANRERRREISRESNRRRRATRSADLQRELDQKWNRIGKARRRGAERFVITDRDMRRLVHRQRGRCAYCGGARPLTVEHVIPVARGGRHSIGNIVLACVSCNCSKRDALLIEWGVGRPAVAAGSPHSIAVRTTVTV